MSTKLLSFFLFFSLIVSLFSVCVVGLASASATHTIGFFEETGGSIRISAVGVTYGAGTYTFSDGASIIITAFADAGYSFANFTFTGGSTQINPIYTYALSDFNITAYFESGDPNTHTVTLAQSGGGVVSVNTMEGVESWVGVGQLEVYDGVALPVSVVTYVGYEFESILLKDVTGRVVSQYFYNPVNITIDADYTIEAVFSYEGITPTPDPNEVIGGIMDTQFGQIILVLLIIFVPPMLVLVGAPKVGYMGFFVILLLMVLVGVQYGIIEPYFLFVMILGFGLMFISAMRQVV